MTIPLHISPRIIQNIASLYTDTNRIFMEYIDNSIDSADMNFFNKEKNSYMKEIEIVILIKGENYNNGAVVITDNCYGIDNFTKVVENIGDSDKKNSRFLNGQFGFGIYSFLAACEKLEIITKIDKSESAFYFAIDKNKFKAKRQEEVQFPDPEPIETNLISGTKITLSKFDKDKWKDIDARNLANEIEIHFEGILNRKNLFIKVIYSNGLSVICKPIQYNRYSELYVSTENKLSLQKGRKTPRKVDLIPVVPINISLYLTIEDNHNIQINRPPVFLAKGRRISTIKEIKKFKSNNKSEIWGHPNITGFIDVFDFLDPTIARDDFQNTDKSKAMFSHLLEIEPLILEKLRELTKRSEDKSYQKFEDTLTNILSQLAREDDLKFRKIQIMGNETFLKNGSIGYSFENGDGGKDDYGNGKQGKGKSIGDKNEDGKKIHDVGKYPSNIDGGDSPKFDETNESQHKGKEIKKPGFDIKFEDVEPDIDERTNEPKRSKCAGGTIYIFKKHPDFIDRIKLTNTNEVRITQRLITYIAGEITIHYKDRFQTRLGQPEYSKEMFIDLVEFIYRFEKALSNMDGKLLKEI